MRTGKALAKRTGNSLFSKPMLCLYVTVFVLIYVLATMYTANVASRRHIDALEREMNSLKAKPPAPPPPANAGGAPAAPTAATGGAGAAAGGDAETLKAKVRDQQAQIEHLLAVQAQSAAIHAQNQQAQHPPPQPVAPPPHKEPEPQHAPIQAPPQHEPAPAANPPGPPPAAAAAPPPPAAAPNPPAAAPAGAKTGADEEKRAAVKAALMHSWDGYKKYAWGTDELMPQAKTGHNWLGQGGTIIDAMTTLAIMGEVDEFKKAAEWVKTSLSFDRGDVSFFETIIRILGGLVSAYEFSCDLYACDEGLLMKAKDIGDRTLKSFNSPSGLPYASINLRNGRGSTAGWTGGSAILAEIASVQLEFGSLSRHLKDPSYDERAMAVFHHLDKINKPDGLMPLYVDVHSGQWTSAHVSLGAMGDSAFEYLLKVWLQRGSKDAWLFNMYDKASKGIIDHLIQTSRAGQVYVAERKGGSLIHKMDHLACFVGGMFVLGSSHMADPAKHLEVGKGIGETCHQMYSKMASGLAPENSEFGGGDLRAGAVYNIQRPETVETFFYLWRATKDPIWREYGWQVFQAFEKCCKIPTGGYVGVRDVRQAHPPKDDTQQTFWLAETLKYLYLLFSEDELIPLDKYVFNTEAHPLKIWKD